MTQKYTSKNTSTNVINKIYKQCSFKPNSRILDYGGGKYDSNAEYMKEKNGSTVMVYDKYNRMVNHNISVMQACREKKPDYIVCSNVLNVIMEEEVIDDILENIWDICSDETPVYIAIYEGDKSGIGQETSRGYQRNEKAETYNGLISKYFFSQKKGNIFMCTKRKLAEI